jgi:hypothetical protein
LGVGVIVQFTHWPLLTELHVTVANPVPGHPRAGHEADGKFAFGAITSLYFVPPEVKSTPIEQFGLDVTTFTRGTALVFWSKHKVYVSRFCQ